MRVSLLLTALLSVFGCSSHSGSKGNAGAGTGGGGAHVGGANSGGRGGTTSGAAAASGRAADAGGSGVGGTSTGGSNDGGTAKNGSGGTGGTKADAGSKPPLAPDPCAAARTCAPGVWTNVTPSGMDATVLRPSKDAYGPGSIVGDPARPSDLYVGGSKAGLWKSSDYGNTWTLVNDTLPDIPRGVTIAVAGTTPATVWASAYNSIYKSTDGGKTFKQTNMNGSLYSLEVDPYDDKHLISGLHEADGMMESKDGGDTWQTVAGSGWPSGGVSWYPDFIDTGDASTTRTTWFAIAQNGASPIMTSDSGAHWTTPNGVNGLQHPHGNSQLYQRGSTLFVAGVNGPGQGVYRSTDLGKNWARVDSGRTPEAIVWGTSKNVYAMYAWACSSCDLGTDFESAAQPGDTWSAVDVPSPLVIGPNSVVVTSDGTHEIFVAVMWDQGIWRYVEP